jgi:hypothetical protein
MKKQAIFVTALAALGGCWGGDGPPSKEDIAATGNVKASMISNVSCESAKPKNGYICGFTVHVPRTGNGLLGMAHNEPGKARFYKDTNGNWKSAFAF